MFKCTTSFTSFSLAQNLKVDKRNGFKSLNLGTSIEKFENLVIISKTRFKISALWTPKNTELHYLFEEKIDYFELSFDPNTLELIAIHINILFKKVYTDPNVYNKFFKMSTKLVLALGSPIKVDSEKLEFIWLGNKVGMSFRLKPLDIDFDDNGEIIGSTSLILDISSLNQSRKLIKNGF